MFKTAITPLLQSKIKHFSVAVLAAVALQFSAGALAEVNLSDVKEGMVIKDARIDRSGFLSDPIPVPNGEWTVIKRIDSVQSFTGFKLVNNFPFVTLYLRNVDTTASLAFVRIRVNSKNDNVRFNQTCSQKGFEQYDDTTDFGSTPSMFRFVCAHNVYQPSLQMWIQERLIKNPSSFVTWGPMQGLENDMPNAVFLSAIDANHLEGLLLTYHFFFNVPQGADFSVGSVAYKAAHDWVRSTGEKLERALHGKKIEIIPLRF